MVIYADVVFLVNFAADFIVIRTAALCLHREVKTAKILIASGTAAVYGVSVFVIPFLSFGIVKAVFSALMVWFVFREKSVRGFVRDMTVFYTAAFIFCGIVSAVFSFFSADIIIRSVNGGHLGTGMSLWVFMAALIPGYLFMPYMQKLFRKNSEKPYYNVEVEYNGRKDSTKAVLDTGNMLSEPVSGTCVVVSDKSFSERLLDGASLTELKGVRIIPYRTIDSNGVMYAVKVRLYIEGQKDRMPKEVYMAMSDRVFAGYHILLQTQLIE